jgi:molecular chaperone GrpE
MQRALAAEQRLTEVVAAYRKLKEETESIRDRLRRDIERRYERKHHELLIGFIEILDNFERALDHAQQSGAQGSFIEGVILVRTRLVQMLQEQGLSWIPVRGLAFDPECSEVVDMEAVEDPSYDQVVIRELERGYRLNGKVVRHARVVVGQYRAPGEDLVSEKTVAPESPPVSAGEPPPEPPSDPMEALPEPGSGSAGDEEPT